MSQKPLPQAHTITDPGHENQAKQLRGQAQSILHGIRIAINETEIPAATTDGLNTSASDESDRLQLPEQAAVEEEKEPLDRVIEELDDAIYWFSLSAEATAMTAVSIGKHYEKIGQLVEKVLSRIAAADVEIADLKRAFDLFEPVRTPTFDDYIRANMDYFAKELGEFEGEYQALMAKVLKQSPEGARIGNFLAKHLKSLETIEKGVPYIDLVWASLEAGFDVGRSDFQGVAVEGTLAVLAAVLILTMPLVFPVYYFAEPFLKFVERNVKKGPTWEQALKRHLRGEPMFPAQEGSQRSEIEDAQSQRRSSTLRTSLAPSVGDIFPGNGSQRRFAASISPAGPTLPSNRTPGSQLLHWGLDRIRQEGSQNPFKPFGAQGPRHNAPLNPGVQLRSGSATSILPGGISHRVPIVASKPATLARPTLSAQPHNRTPGSQLLHWGIDRIRHGGLENASSRSAQNQAASVQHLGTRNQAGEERRTASSPQIGKQRRVEFVQPGGPLIRGPNHPSGFVRSPLGHPPGYVNPSPTSLQAPNSGGLSVKLFPGFKDLRPATGTVKPASAGPDWNALFYGRHSGGPAQSISGAKQASVIGAINVAGPKVASAVPNWKKVVSASRGYGGGSLKAVPGSIARHALHPKATMPIAGAQPSTNAGRVNPVASQCMVCNQVDVKNWGQLLKLQRDTGVRQNLIPARVQSCYDQFFSKPAALKTTFRPAVFRSSFNAASAGRTFGK